MKFKLLILTSMLSNINLLVFKLSVVVFIMLINVKNANSCWYFLTFMSMIFILSIVEHEKKFYSRFQCEVEIHALKITFSFSLTIAWISS